VAHDPAAGRNFLLCDYNRDMDSYRSPWSGQYFPALEDGDVPPPPLRRLEQHANEVRLGCWPHPLTPCLGGLADGAARQRDNI
jgi:hypothetical protein